MQRNNLFIIMFLLIVVASNGFCEKDSGCTKPLNEKYSFKDLHNQSFLSIDKAEFSNTCIKGSNFYRELGIDSNGKRVKIFPNGSVGIQFVRCNLDNIVSPANSTIDDRSTNKRIKVQNDLEDWVLDEVSGGPKEPKDKNGFSEKGISMVPENIPKVRSEKPRRDK